MQGLRREYQERPLRRVDLAPNPLDQLLQWIQEAAEAGISEVNAMSLATASPDGAPSLRTILAKTIDQKSITFFTNYNSRKGRELLANPIAVVNFFWREFERQVTVEGSVKKASSEDSVRYWQTRPRGSQLSAWASSQGEVISSRDVLERRLEELTARFHGRPIPLPPFWGGFMLIAQRVEVWQGRRDRLHDRFQYLLQEGQWVIERLSP